jgi:hypothetical protein
MGSIRLKSDGAVYSGQLIAFPAAPDKGAPESRIEIVPKTSAAASNDVQGPRLVSVKALAARYGLNKAAIYGSIKTDPTFPYANVGLKKKFMIDVCHFETWLARRTDRQKHEHFAIPSTADLLAAFKGSSK